MQPFIVKILGISNKETREGQLFSFSLNVEKYSNQPIL